MTTIKILLVEDEDLVGTMVLMNLSEEGYDVAWEKNGREGLERARKERFDLLLLDIALPEVDGLQILSALRKEEIGTPILMLTARGETRSKVTALDLGADDYLPKPFDVAELVARVRALVRRSRAEREIPATRIVRFGDYEINLDSRDAKTNEGELTLSEKETAVLEMLLRAHGEVLRRSDILDEVWGMDATPTERTVDNVVVRLRKLFEPDSEAPRHILTVRGSGYRFRT